MFSILPVIRKELIHIRRDPRTLAIIIIMPLLQLLLFGYAIDMDVKDIKIGVLDQSRTPASRELISKFTDSDYFDRTEVITTRSQIQNLFRACRIKAALVIPEDFERSVRRHAVTPVQIIIDGTDANTGSIILNTTRQLLTEASFAASGLSKPPLNIATSIWYNPDQKSSHYIVPGLVAVLLMMICALLTSITITREKETGTMEQILVSPLKPHQVIIGKILPYVGLASVAASLVLLMGRFWFGVPFVGSLLVLTLLSLLYLLTALAFGILISTVAQTQQVAMMLALMGTMLPSVMLSGFVFPVRSMPLALQWLSKVIPATHYLVIIRGILLKGNGWSVLYPYAVYLVLLSLFLLAIGVKQFKIRLE